MPETQQSVKEPGSMDTALYGLEPLDRETFQDVVSLVYHKAGIKLGPQKEALVSARLARRMRQLGIRRYSEYYRRVHDDTTGAELVEMLNCISTNVTSFYRDPRHFEFLANALKNWRQAGQNRFRLWSAACSTGEEPYTMALTVLETLAPPYDVKILATDLSTKTLKRARDASYDKQQVQGVSPILLAKHFTCETDSEKTVYQVSPPVRRLVTFGRLNLSVVPFPMHGPFDVVFCRHVMMYFDNEVRNRLLNEVHRLLRPGGYLVVGRAESLCAIHHGGFKNVESSVYVKTG